MPSAYVLRSTTEANVLCPGGVSSSNTEEGAHYNDIGWAGSKSDLLLKNFARLSSLVVVSSPPVKWKFTRQVL